MYEVVSGGSKHEERDTDNRPFLSLYRGSCERQDRRNSFTRHCGDRQLSRIGREEEETWLEVEERAPPTRSGQAP